MTRVTHDISSDYLCNVHQLAMDHIFDIPAAKKVRTRSPPRVQHQVCSTPQVLAEHSPLLTRPTDSQINVNIPYHDLIQPIQGPENPFADRNRFLNQNALAGHVEEQAMSDHAFNAQHLTHAILGYSLNPSVDPNAPAFLGSLDSAAQNAFATIDTMRPTNAQKRDLKRKRKHKGTLDIVDGDGAYLGPWAAWEGEDQAAFLDGVEEDDEPDLPEQDDEPEAPVVKKKAKPKRGGVGQESSVFHGKSMTDYQGRTYMHPPLADAPHLSSEPGSQETFIPKACIHTWTGHTQGVSAIRLFPDTGHLLLSGSMDTKIKARDPSPLHPSFLTPPVLLSCGTCIPMEIVSGLSTATFRPSRMSPSQMTVQSSCPVAMIVR